MATLLLGAAALFVVLWVMQSYAKVDPKILARVLQRSGGIIALIAAVVLMTRGHLELAIPLGLAGLGMLGYQRFNPAAWFGIGKRSSGQTSRVRAPFLEMELDHDSGAMRGTIVAGRHQGAKLDEMETSALIDLLDEFDADSQALLAAYLDRRSPGWRDGRQQRSTPGGSRNSAMTTEIAREILGVGANASEREIAEAHRTLMKKLHPDQGGSNHLAAQVNQAKEVLLGRRC